MEGLLIEAHRRLGRWPVWNRRGGSKQGQKHVTVNSGVLLDCLTTKDSGPLVAKSSLREISTNATYYTYEEMVLHPVRMIMLATGMPFVDAMEVQLAAAGDYEPMYREIIAEMDKDGYFAKTPDLSGTNPASVE